MKKTKKGLLLALTLAMSTTLFVACGGNEGGNSNDNGTSVPDAGASKGEQITQLEWATAVANTFVADNVTVNAVYTVEMKEDGVSWGGKMEGVLKLADGVQYTKMFITETENGASESWTEESYVYEEDGTCYEWYKDSIDTPDWVQNEYKEDDYSATLFGVIFNDMLDEDAELLISLYEELEFNEETGEYSVFVEDEYDPYTMKFKVVDDLFYTFTIRFESDETQGEVGFSEKKYVFVDYGKTSIGKLPGEEGTDNEDGKDSASQGGSTDGSDVPGESLADEAAWGKALTATATTTNATVQFSIKDDQYMGEFFDKWTAICMAEIADGKIFLQENVDFSHYYEEDGVVEKLEKHDEFQTYITTVDGVPTAYSKTLESNWQSYPYEVDYNGVFSAVLGFVFDEFLEMNLDFVIARYSGFVYENGTYVYTFIDEEDVGKLELKFENGLLVWGRMSEEGYHYDSAGQNVKDVNEMSFTVSYGGAQVVLPNFDDDKPSGGDDNNTDIGGDNSNPGIGDNDNVGGGGDFNMPDVDVEIDTPTGEWVDEAEWNRAWNTLLDADNLIIVGHRIGPEVDMRMVFYLDGERFFAKVLTDMGEEYRCMGIVDGEYYVWVSADGENWEAMELGAAEDFVPMKGRDLIDGFLGANDFASAVFNDTRKDYTIHMSNEMVFFYEVKIANGQVVELDEYYDQDKWQLSIEYGTAVIDSLPPINNVGDDDVIYPDDGNDDSGDSGDSGNSGNSGVGMVDEATWEKAFETMKTATNFTMNGSSTVKFDTYSSIVWEFTMQIADNKGYSEMSDYEGRQYSYVGNVDGKNYEWYSEDGENWTCEYVGDAYELNGENVLAEMFPLDIGFDNFYYDEAKRGYRYDMGTTSWVVRIYNGMITAMELDFVEVLENGERRQQAQMFLFTYGDAIVGDLPPVQNVIGGDDVGGSSNDNTETDEDDTIVDYPVTDKPVVNYPITGYAA
ncbi:MAG: hypothetical protein E7352_04690 [Clostridiales bacterium]|nr:hypothetical protein [Clostridiales bacterium]